MDAMRPFFLKRLPSPRAEDPVGRSLPSLEYLATITTAFTYVLQPPLFPPLGPSIPCSHTMLRISVFALGLLTSAAQGVRIVQANDDGWAELYVRSLHDALLAAGHDPVLCGPAENKSGTSSLDVEPSDRTTPCQYDSCAAGSGPAGTNVTSPRLNWVNSFPVTSMRFAIDTFGPQVWGDDEKPDLAVTGPNVGSNMLVAVPFSGTVGSAVYAAHEASIPAIAFSGASDGNLAWNTEPVPERSTVYAKLAADLVDRLVKDDPPYLPKDVWLNVNFPKAEGACTDPANYKWVASRIYPGWFSQPDANTCGSDRLPTETEVVGTDGCFISVSFGDARDKTDTSADNQAIVLKRLGDFLSCLP
jgi:5'/3'-nucleotidase SurE